MEKTAGGGSFAALEFLIRLIVLPSALCASSGGEQGEEGESAEELNWQPPTDTVFFPEIPSSLFLCFFLILTQGYVY